VSLQEKPIKSRNNVSEINGLKNVTLSINMGIYKNENCETILRYHSCKLAGVGISVHNA